MKNRLRRVEALERVLSKDSDSQRMDTLRLVLRALKQIHESDGTGPFEPERDETIINSCWRWGWTPEHFASLVDRHWAPKC